MKRKSFIQRALNGWIAVVSMPVMYAVARYLTPPAKTATGPIEIIAGRLESLVPGTLTPVRQGGHALFVTQSRAGELEAFSAKCPHLGCIVEHARDIHRLRCNCHGSLFDESGVNLTGPATQPLQRYRVDVRDGSVIVTVL